MFNTTVSNISRVFQAHPVEIHSIEDSKESKRFRHEINSLMALTDYCENVSKLRDDLNRFATECTKESAVSLLNRVTVAKTLCHRLNSTSLLLDGAKRALSHHESALFETEALACHILMGGVECEMSQEPDRDLAEASY